MSHLVNTPDDGVRRELLLSCARHLAADGVLVGQRHPPVWFESASESDGTDGAVHIKLRDVSRPLPGLVTATVCYENSGREWTHTFTAKCLSDEAIAGEMTAVRLVFGTWLDDQGSWFTAHLAKAPSRAQVAY